VQVLGFGFGQIVCPRLGTSPWTRRAGKSLEIREQIHPCLWSALDHAITEAGRKRQTQELRSGAGPVAEGYAGHVKEIGMIGLLIQWLLYAIALLVVSRLVPGFTVDGLWPAMVAALVIGLLNATVGFFLKIVTFPLSIVTLGLFLLVINALMILLASSIVRGFRVNGFVPAFWGAVVLALLGMAIRALTKNA